MYDLGHTPMKSVLRAFDELNAFWAVNGVGPSRGPARIDVPKSTAYVYLRTLEETDELVTFVIEETRPFRDPPGVGESFVRVRRRLGEVEDAYW